MATNKTKSDKATEEIAVVITTEHRGVFFGYINPAHVNDDQIEAKQARLCVWWSAAMHGFMGLASMGPDKQCKIGPAVESITLRKITSVIKCSPEAIAKWKAEPWA